MNTYRTLAVLNLGPGAVVALSAVQASARRQCLADRGKGRYEVTAAVQFKAGEVLGIDGDLGKAVESLVESTDAGQKGKTAAAPDKSKSLLEKAGDLLTRGDA